MTTIPQHKPAELVEVGPPRPQKLAIALFGDGGAGKTRMSVTSPGPIGIVPLNAKCRATVERARLELCPQKKIYFPVQDLIRHGNPMKLAMMDPFCERKIVIGLDAPVCCARHYYRWHVNRVKDALWTMAERKDIRTIVIDDATQLYEDILYAHYGRANRISDQRTAYGPVNQELIDLINSLDGNHLVLINQAKEEYRGDTPTGRDTVKGFKDIGYHCNVLAELSRDPVKQQFRLSVRMCQDRAALHGDAGKNLLTDSDITFLDLAMKIFGDECDLTEYAG